MNVLILALLFVFVIGLCVGSFLNVVILRALSNESIAFPPSKCPKCQNKLKWWHNIPVLSYIILRGKCAYCKEHINIQYPIVEILTALIFTIIFVGFGISFDTIFMWAIASMLIVLAGTDIREKVVFDLHTYILIGIAVIYSICITCISAYQMHLAGINISKEFFLFNPITSSILGIIVGAIVMEVCSRIGFLIAGTRAFGEGDTLIAAGLGAVFGWYQFLYVLLLSILIQVIIFLPIFIKGLLVNREWKTLISFSVFALYAIVFYMMSNLLQNVWYITGAVILAAIGILVCVFIFKGLREHPENRTYLPFGPAMVAASFIMIFLQMFLVG